MDNTKIISVLLSVISLLMVNTQASNLPLKNINGREEQGSIVSKPFTENTIVTKNATNPPIPTANTTVSNSARYTFGKVQGKAVTTTTRSSYYDSDSSYATPESSQSLSPGAIAGIVIGIILLLCCCSAGTYKRQELWELRRIH